MSNDKPAHVVKRSLRVTGLSLVATPTDERCTFKVERGAAATNGLSLCSVAGHVIAISDGAASCSRCGETNEDAIMRDGFTFPSEEFAKVNLDAVPGKLGRIVAEELGLLTVQRLHPPNAGTIVLQKDEPVPPWNICPACHDLADADDIEMGGTELKCCNCGIRLVAECYGEGDDVEWKLILASEYFGPDTDDSSDEDEVP